MSIESSTPTEPLAITTLNDASHALTQRLEVFAGGIDARYRDFGASLGRVESPLMAALTDRWTLPTALDGGIELFDLDDLGAVVAEWTTRSGYDDALRVGQAPLVIPVDPVEHPVGYTAEPSPRPRRSLWARPAAAAARAVAPRPVTSAAAMSAPRAPTLVAAPQAARPAQSPPSAVEPPSPRVDGLEATATGPVDEQVSASPERVGGVAPPAAMVASAAHGPAVRPARPARERWRATGAGLSPYPRAMGRAGAIEPRLLRFPEARAETRHGPSRAYFGASPASGDLLPDGGVAPVVGGAERLLQSIGQRIAPARPAPAAAWLSPSRAGGASPAIGPAAGRPAWSGSGLARSLALPITRVGVDPMAPGQLGARMDAQAAQVEAPRISSVIEPGVGVDPSPRAMEADRVERAFVRPAPATGGVDAGAVDGAGAAASRPAADQIAAAQPAPVIARAPGAQDGATSSAAAPSVIGSSVAVSNTAVPSSGGSNAAVANAAVAKPAGSSAAGSSAAVANVAGSSAAALTDTPAAPPPGASTRAAGPDARSRPGSVGLSVAGAPGASTYPQPLSSALGRVAAYDAFAARQTAGPLGGPVALGWRSPGDPVLAERLGAGMGQGLASLAGASPLTVGVGLGSPFAQPLARPAADIRMARLDVGAPAARGDIPRWSGEVAPTGALVRPSAGSAASTAVTGAPEAVVSEVTPGAAVTGARDASASTASTAASNAATSSTATSNTAASSTLAGPARAERSIAQALSGSASTARVGQRAPEVHRASAGGERAAVTPGRAEPGRAARATDRFAGQIMARLDRLVAETVARSPAESREPVTEGLVARMGQTLATSPTAALLTALSHFEQSEPGTGAEAQAWSALVSAVDRARGVPGSLIAPAIAGPSDARVTAPRSARGGATTGPGSAGLGALRSSAAVLDATALDGAALDGAALDGAALDGAALDGAAPAAPAALRAAASAGALVAATGAAAPGAPLAPAAARADALAHRVQALGASANVDSARVRVARVRAWLATLGAGVTTRLGHRLGAPLAMHLDAAERVWLSAPAESPSTGDTTSPGDMRRAPRPARASSPAGEARPARATTRPIDRLGRSPLSFVESRYAPVERALGRLAAGAAGPDALRGLPAGFIGSTLGGDRGQPGRPAALTGSPADAFASSVAARSARADAWAARVEAREAGESLPNPRVSALADALSPPTMVATSHEADERGRSAEVRPTGAGSTPPRRRPGSTGRAAAAMAGRLSARPAMLAAPQRPRPSTLAARAAVDAALVAAGMPPLSDAPLPDAASTRAPSRPAAGGQRAGRAASPSVGSLGELHHAVAPPAGGRVSRRVGPSISGASADRPVARRALASVMDPAALVAGEVPLAVEGRLPDRVSNLARALDGPAVDVVDAESAFAALGASRVLLAAPDGERFVATDGGEPAPAGRATLPARAEQALVAYERARSNAGRSATASVVGRDGPPLRTELGELYRPVPLTPAADLGGRLFGDRGPQVPTPPVTSGRVLVETGRHHGQEALRSTGQAADRQAETNEEARHRNAGQIEGDLSPEEIEELADEVIQILRREMEFDVARFGEDEWD